MMLEDIQFSEKELFKSNLAYAIRGIYQETLKERGTGYITYIEANRVALFVRKIFMDKLGEIPNPIEEACLESCAILSPEAEAHRKVVKRAVGVGGGIVGTGMTIAGVKIARGWGVGVIGAAISFFTGTALAYPIALAVSGVTLAATSGYYSTRNDAPILSEEFCDKMIENMGKAVDKIWNEYGEKLAQAWKLELC